MSTSSHNSSFDRLTQAQRELAFKRAAERVAEIEKNAPIELSAILKETSKRQCATLKGFTSYFWDVLEPDIKLSWNWHLDELCDVMQSVYDGDSFKEIINVPPGTMKSLLISVFFRAWVWSKDPSKRFLAASYGSHLSIRDNVKLRNLVTSAKYKALFEVHLTGDTNAKEKFENSAGGWSIATSVGGAGTGEHPDFIIVDDPLTEQQSRSKADRDSANNWIDRTLSTRGVTRNVRTVLIMQRLHEEDPTGHLAAKGGWHHIVFPMRYIGFVKFTDGRVEAPDPLDRRTTKGDLLWPSLFDDQKVRSLEIALGPYAAAGQLQQQPSPEGGGLFKRAWFTILDTLPANITRTRRGWDTAGTEGGGDYTVGVRMSEFDEGKYLIDSVVRGQWGPDAVDKIILNTAKSDGKKCGVREEKEGGSAGKAVVTARAKSLRGFDYEGVVITGDKVTRARPFRAQCEAGNVYLLRGDWNEEYISELCAFPTAAKDDQVDGSSCVFNSLLMEEAPFDHVEAGMTSAATW